MKTAICITTRNRPEAFKNTLQAWEKHKPSDATIFIVDDNSDQLYSKPHFRFLERAGIPKAKNKCLELAYNSGAEHIFLSDDDCFPISDEAIPAYINANQNHLSFSFQEQFGSTQQRKPPIKKGNFLIHEIPNGCMLYFTRKCLETVGGFNTNFGLGSCEHIELTRRIFNAKLTPYQNMDLINSNELFYSLDQHGLIERSFSPEQRIYLIQQNNKLLKRLYRSKEYVEFM